MRALIFALLPFLFLMACDSNKKDNLFHGYIEGEFIMIATTSSGILKTLSVKRGDTVKAKDPLFSLDLTDLTTQQKSAQAEVKRLQAELKNARKEYNRVLPLSKTGAASKAKLDNANTKLSNLSNMLETAQQSLVHIEQKLKDAAPLAPSDGIIQNRFYEVGEYIQQGQPVISLLPSDHIKVRFFVSQKKVTSLTLGESLKVRCDGCAAPVSAKISYIAPNAEYTPPVIYSVESRDKLVFLIEATPDEYSSSLHPGLPVSVDLGAKHD